MRSHPSTRAAWPIVLLCTAAPAQMAKPAAHRRDGPVVQQSESRAARIQGAVDRGLAWLAEQQNRRGFWTGIVGSKGRGGYRPLQDFDEQVRAGSGHVGVTAICGMAFLAGGHMPRRGRYGAVVDKAVEAMLASVQDSGLITASGSRMYSHAFATLFLAEVYGVSHDRRLRAALNRATHMVVDCQNALGGWRYNAFSRDADLSVTVCQLQALRAARNVGIEIPKSVIDRAVQFVKDCQVRDGGREDGRYSYSTEGRNRYRKRDQYSIQAAAATSLVSAGIYDRELIEPVIDFLEEDLGKVMFDYPHHYYFWYGNYYASQAIFHADAALGRRGFQRYYMEVSAHLLEDQQADGRWLNPPEQGPCDAFGTAVACILLQIPNQYLPIFQR